MNEKIGEIVERMKALELELEAELNQACENIRYRLVDQKIHFEHEAL